MEEDRHLHGGVLWGIARLTDIRCRETTHKMLVSGEDMPPINRQSWEHLVTFLDGDSHEVTELELILARLANPSDGGFQVMRDFFSRSDTMLTKVTMHYCNWGSQNNALQLLTAFEQNRTVTDLTIRRIRNLEGAALGACLSSLMQNIPQLQRLDCKYSNLRVEGVRAFQPALQANRTLKELQISECILEDEGIHLIADTLVGNTTMEVLGIYNNRITSNCLADITRLIESTQLKTIYFPGTQGVFNDEDATQHFASTLQHKKSSLQELCWICPYYFPEDSRAATFTSINNSLTRNRYLNHVNLLLAPPPPQQQQQNHHGAAMMMFKTWHKAITKFAMAPNNTGASAIFKLFQARPALLEKRLKRPAAAAAAATAAISQEQKRRRL